MSNYRVIVSWSESAVVCIEGETANDAAKRAHALIEGGHAHYPLHPLNRSDYRVDEVQSLVNPDDEERVYIKENAEAWAEYQEEREWCCIPGCFDDEYKGGYCELHFNPS